MSGNKDLRSNEYDTYLTQKAGSSRSAKQELEQRHAERKGAHDSNGVGYHFGLGDSVVKVESKEHLRHELNRRGLMLETDVKTQLRGPAKHEFTRRK